METLKTVARPLYLIGRLLTGVTASTAPRTEDKVTSSPCNREKKSEYLNILNEMLSGGGMR